MLAIVARFLIFESLVTVLADILIMDPLQVTTGDG